MISTSFMNGTGFMKCMPMKRSGRSVAAASSVIEMLDVFVARMAFFDKIGWSVANRSFLMPRILDDGFDDEIAVREDVQRGRTVQPRQRGVGVLTCHPLLVHEAIEALGDARQALLERVVEGVEEPHLRAGDREYLRDARAHLSGADDAYPFE